MNLTYLCIAALAFFGGWVSGYLLGVKDGRAGRTLLDVFRQANKERND
jgi:hypothetical protein